MRYSGKPGIVCWFPGNAGRHDQSTPLSEDLRIVRQKRKQLF